MKWTSEQVAGFVNQLPGCDTQGKVFHEEVCTTVVLLKKVVGFVLSTPRTPRSVNFKSLSKESFSRIMYFRIYAISNFHSALIL